MSASGPEKWRPALVGHSGDGLFRVRCRGEERKNPGRLSASWSEQLGDGQSLG